MIKKKIGGILLLALTVILVLFIYSEAQKKQALVAEIEAGPKEWVSKQIALDLASLKGQKLTPENIRITLENVDPFHRKRLCHFKIKDSFVKHVNKECICHKRKPNCFACGYVRKLQEISSIRPLPDCEFLIYNADGVEIWENEWMNKKNYLTSAPIFAFARCGDTGNEKVILFPDYASFLDDRFLTSAYKWKKLVVKTQKLNRKISWEKKENKAFWRGAASRGCYSKDGWRSASRSRLALLSRQNPDVIDAQFTKLKHVDAEVVAEMESLGLIGDFIAADKQGHYKYQINMDGWKCTYPGFQWRLLLDCLVFKEDSSDKQWFYDAIKPYQHYIPFSPDKGDLIDKLKWAQQNDGKAKEISRRATDFVENNLLERHVMAYAYFLLTEYSKVWQEN